MQTQTRPFKLSVFFSPWFVRETEASEDNSSVTHIWAWHRQTGRDPLCIEGYSWLQLKEGKKNGFGGEGVRRGAETTLWPRTSTYKHFRYQKSTRRDQNLSFAGEEKNRTQVKSFLFFLHLLSVPLFLHFHCPFTHERMSLVKNILPFL